MLGKIGSGCRFDSVGIVAEKNLVEIQGQDFILAQLLFQTIGEDDFLDFALVALFRREHEAFDNLLGDGAAAARFFSGFQIGEHGPYYSLEIHAGVLVELVILNGEKGLGQPGRHFFLRYEKASFPIELADQTSIPGKNIGDERRAVVRDFAETRQVIAGPQVDGSHSSAPEQSAHQGCAQQKAQNTAFFAGAGGTGRLRPFRLLPGGAGWGFRARQIQSEPVKLVVMLFFVLHGMSEAATAVCALSGAEVHSF